MSIHLSAARTHQLRQLASYHGCPAIDLLDEFIRGSWEWAGFDADLPPFDFSVGRDDETGEPRVHFAAPGTDILDFSANQAQAVARGIMALVDRKASRFVVAARCAGRPGGLLGERRGRGYVLKICGDRDGEPCAAVVSMTTSVGEDLARIFADRGAKARAMAS